MRRLVHDLVKIRYSEEGYLPYYPYHLISEEEMIDAFIFNESNFFDDFYPCMFKEVEQEHSYLKSYIQEACGSYKKDPENVLIPDWVYSYMLGSVIGPESSQKDKHDLFVLLNMDNLYDEFTPSICKSIAYVSERALGRSRSKSSIDDSDRRPVTVFGEPHIVKYLRLEQVSVRP